MSGADWRGIALACPSCRGSLAEREGSCRCTECGAVYAEEGGILDLSVGRSGAAAYDPHFFSVLRETEGRHFWFVARCEVVFAVMRRAIPDLDRRRLFDIGCGTGGLLESLGRRGVGLVGACDAYPESLHLVRRRLDVPLILVDEGRRAPLGEGQTLVGMFDVLEHVDDDVGTLGHVHGVLEPGGYLVLTVPAHPALFGPLDAAACHRRRYSRQELGRKLAEAGFEVVALSHFMLPLAPVLLLARWLERVRRRSSPPKGGAFRVVPVVNEVLRAVLWLERAAMRWVSMPFGSSLIAVARRSAAPVLR